MNEYEKYTIQLPDNVVADMRAYRQNLEAFLQGATSAMAFKVYRVATGIYEERSGHTYMVRIRIGAGLVTPSQLRAIADIGAAYGNGVAHVTTRQDIQLHGVQVEDTPDVIEQLLAAGLSPRGGGGNTVRNITACPRAGVSADEVFNVAPYAVALAEFLLAQPGSYTLPRKFKIAFSGCRHDSAMATAGDLGFVATTRDGKEGFTVFAGGGLGADPKAALKVEQFVPVDAVFQVAHALKKLFSEHGDRAHKHRARLRYVRDRIGDDAFQKLYLQYRRQAASESLPLPVPEIRHWPSSPDAQNDSVPQNTYVQAENRPGYYTLRLKLDKGDIRCDDLLRLADVAETYSRGFVRTTQLQDMLLTRVAGTDVRQTLEALHALESVTFDDPLPTVVNCTGARTCKLGLCLSRGLAEAINEHLKTLPEVKSDSSVVIRISGCANSCASHTIAQLGFEGRAKRINGRLMPFYEVLAGGHLDADGAVLAKRFGAVPARRIPSLVADLLAGDMADSDFVESVVAAYRELPAEIAEDYFYDIGSEVPFSLAGRGAGECGAGVMDVITSDIKQAREALGRAQQAGLEAGGDSLYSAIVSAARALLVLFGLEPMRDREVFHSFRQNLIAPGWVSPDVQTLLDAALDWKMGQGRLLAEAVGQTAALIERVVELFHSLDANLKFTADPYHTDTAVNEAEESVRRYTADLRGVACPMNFVKAKLELEKIPLGQTLEILLDKGEPQRNVPASLRQQSQDVLDEIDHGQYVTVVVKRLK